MIKKNEGKPRMTLEEAKKLKGRSNLAKLFAEQLKEKKKIANK